MIATPRGPLGKALSLTLACLMTLSCEKGRRTFGASVDALAGPTSAVTSAKKANLRQHRNVVNFAAAADESAPAGMRGGAAMPVAAAPPPPPEAKDAPKGDVDGELASTPAAPVTRAWFPESFLFDPLVVTDAEGKATVNLTVPDRLTSWRVLALAHSREGAQAGAAVSFLGTLPTYVDPVIPSYLLAGDEVRLPVQVVNTTDQEVTQTLHLTAEGVSLTGSDSEVKVPPGGSAVRFAELDARRPGPAFLKAVLGDTDAVVRTFGVLPNGRSMVLSQGGTLASPREVTLTADADAEPDSAKVRLTVYPGALALLRSELGAAAGRGSAADDAYTLLLAGKAPQLLASLGEKADPLALRNLTLLTGQRVIREARNPDVATAALLAQAALSHPENPVLLRAGQRLAATVAGAQRPDGTFQGADGWTVQRLQVTTAECFEAVRSDTSDDAAKQRTLRAEVQASGFFERTVGEVHDGYTAAAILASGAVKGEVQERLRGIVREAVVRGDDGSRSLPVADEVVRADGDRPSPIEATSLAALALEGDPKAPWRADLGAALLSSYSPSTGWGDGRANLVALRAVLDLFKDPLPPSVAVSLSMDGKLVAEGTLSGQKLHDILALDAAVPDAAGAHTWHIAATPPVPGFGYALAVQTWVPWRKTDAQAGLELAIKVPDKGKVGQASTVEVVAAAPAGMPLEIRENLPAGVQPDTASLDQLVQSSTIERYHVETGSVTLSVKPLESGEHFTARFKVVPTLAGKLHAVASRISVTDQPSTGFDLPSSEWVIN